MKNQNQEIFETSFIMKAGHLPGPDVFSQAGKMLSLFLSSTTEFFVIVDRNLNVQLFNEATRIQAKIYMNVDMYKGINIMELVPVERREPLKKIYAEVFEGVYKETETEILLPDGTKEYLHNTFKPAKAEDGTIIAAIVTTQNITEKKASEKELQKSNERFKLASKATSDAIYDWDLITNMLTWSDGIEVLFGYTSNEVTIKIWEDLIHEDDRKGVSESLIKVIEDNTTNYWKAEYRYKKKDGTYCYVLDKGFVARDENGKPIRMIGAMHDISDQKIKEQELIESNERFFAVMKATNDLIWDWNLETGIFYRDEDGMKKVYGVEDAGSIRNIYHWLQRIHPGDHAHVQSILNDVLHAKEQNSFEVEYRFKRDAGDYSHVYDRGILLRNGNGKPIRMIGAAQDITERKKLEQELLHKELDRQKLISQASIETQEQERTEIGKELHDNVNQVLTTTKLYLELSQTNAELKDDLIQKSTKNVIYVINEIRQLSRSLMNPSIGDIGLIDSIQDLAENINITKHLQVLLETDEVIEEVLSENYKLMIYRIIQEALNNTIKHSQAENVLISLGKQNDVVVLMIDDDGIGFDPTTVKRGAGLKNIQNRVYLVSGSFTIESTPGEGAKLIIHFPISKQSYHK